MDIVVDSSGLVSSNGCTAQLIAHVTDRDTSASAAACGDATHAPQGQTRPTIRTHSVINLLVRSDKTSAGGEPVYPLRVPSGSQIPLLMAHGTEYAIRMTSVNNCDSEVFIDSASIGTFRVHARVPFILSRSASISRIFTFICEETSIAKEAHVRIGAPTNGLIAIVFRPEKIVPPPAAIVVFDDGSRHVPLATAGGAQGGPAVERAPPQSSQKTSTSTSAPMRPDGEPDESVAAAQATSDRLLTEFIASVDIARALYTTAHGDAVATRQYAIGDIKKAVDTLVLPLLFANTSFLCAATRFHSDADQLVNRIITTHSVAMAKYRERQKHGVRWPHSPRVRRDVEHAGFEYRPMMIKRDRCVCVVCGVEVAGWRAYMNADDFHIVAVHARALASGDVRLRPEADGPPTDAMTGYDIEPPPEAPSRIRSAEELLAIHKKEAAVQLRNRLAAVDTDVVVSRYHAAMDATTTSAAASGERQKDADERSLRRLNDECKAFSPDVSSLPAAVMDHAVSMFLTADAHPIVLWLRATESAVRALAQDTNDTRHVLARVLVSMISANAQLDGWREFTRFVANPAAPQSAPRLRSGAATAAAPAGMATASTSYAPTAASTYRSCSSSAATNSGWPLAGGGPPAVAGGSGPPAVASGSTRSATASSGSAHPPAALPAIGGNTDALLTGATTFGRASSQCFSTVSKLAEYDTANIVRFEFKLYARDVSVDMHARTLNGRAIAPKDLLAVNPVDTASASPSKSC